MIKLTSDHKLHEGKKNGHGGGLYHNPGVLHDKWLVYVLLKRMTNDQVWWSMPVIPALRREVETGGQEFQSPFQLCETLEGEGEMGEGGRKKREGREGGRDEGETEGGKENK